MAEWEKRYFEIIKNMDMDLISNVHGNFSAEDISQIKITARKKLDEEISRHQPQTEADLNRLWQEIATDFHTSQYWGYKKNRQIVPPPAQTKQPGLGRFIIMFLFPIIITKTLVLYFGIQYGNYPGEGYGPIFAAVLVLWAFSFGYFLWKTRHYKD